MPFKKFHFQVLLRIILLLLLFISGTYFLTQTSVWLVSFWLYLAFVIVLVNLLRFIEKAHRDLYYFLLSIKERDFSISYPHKKADELNYAFDTINQVLNDLRNEKASNLIYLQTVVEHIGIALICIYEGNIVLDNRAAKKLFRLDHIGSLDKLFQINEELGNTCANLASGEQKLLKIKLYDSLYNLSLEATEFRLQGKSYKLISFKDIKSELEANELESWQKLIRVLTHEIKNSVIPISTLSEVIIQLVKENKSNFEEIDNGEPLADILGGLETIQTRSKGLADFVTSYDQLAKIPQPKFQTVDLNDLVQRVLTLFASDIEMKQINLQSTVDSTIRVEADASLIEQVLINLIKNAIEVVESADNRKISIEAELRDESTVLTITDNGPGIPEEVLENIFVPFYTTKSSGSGIGLSLSRQIMKAHNGNISVSTTSKGSSFKLTF